MTGHTDNVAALYAPTNGTPTLFYGSQGDFILYGAAHWPSFSYWMIPGSELED